MGVRDVSLNELAEWVEKNGYKVFLHPRNVRGTCNGNSKCGIPVKTEEQLPQNEDVWVRANILPLSLEVWIIGTADAKTDPYNESR